MKNSVWEKGFTLLEMLIVLMIISVVIFITFGATTNIYNAQLRNNFIDQLYIDLYYAQSIAITHRRPTTVAFNNLSGQYVIRQGLETKIFRAYNANVTVLAYTLDLTDIVFLADGNIQKSGTILLKFDDDYYKLTLLLGRGRFYIEKI